MKKLFYQSFIFFISVIFFTSCSVDYADSVIILEKPSKLAASSKISGFMVFLSWDAVAYADLYKIYRRPFVGGTSEPFVEVGMSVTNSFSDYGLIPDAAYEYYVQAFAGKRLVSPSEPSENTIGYTAKSTVEDAFGVLAEATKGKMQKCPQVSELSDKIKVILFEHAKAGADIVFLIDNTGSMGDDIANVKANLNAIIGAMPKGARLGVATYGDNNVMPSSWYSSIPLNSNYEMARTFINGITVGGGGDWPESVYDGLYKTMEEMNWAASTQKMVVVIGDAPPLEGSLTRYGMGEVLKIALADRVVTNLFPIVTY